MITQEFKDKWNGEEIMFQIDWMSKPINCVVLADLEEGVSIKPYYTNDEEKEIFITDIHRELKFNSRKETENFISRPTYCLLHASKNIDEYEMEKILTYKGNKLLSEVITTFYGRDPSCPFA